MESNGRRVLTGMPVVLSAPSGGGKSTIAEALIQNEPSLVRSISCTTRPIRPGERHGIDYFFVNPAEFRKKAENYEFLEWASVHDNSYGTPRQTVTEHLSEGRDVLLVIDPQGAVEIKKAYPDGLFIFVVPPTWEALEERLKGRGTDNAAVREKRLQNARKELTYLCHYNYLVTNDDLNTAVADVRSILRAHRLLLIRQNKRAIPILAETDGGI